MWYEMALSGIIGSLTGILCTYVMLTKLRRKGFFSEIATDIIYEASENPDLQRRIYMLGALLGNGVKSGIGLPRKTGGKFSLENLIMQIVGGYVASKVAPGTASPVESVLGTLTKKL